MRENIRFACQILSGFGGALAVIKFINDSGDKTGGSAMIWGAGGLALLVVFVLLSWEPFMTSKRLRQELTEQCEYFIRYYQKLQADCGIDTTRRPRDGSSWPEFKNGEAWEYVHFMLFTLDREMHHFLEVAESVRHKSFHAGDGSFVDLIRGLEDLKKRL